MQRLDPATTCPRCGYDLAGIRSAAPQAVSGMCSECGLAFEWSELAEARLHPPRFSYEHGRVWNLSRFVRTFLRGLTGWPLWSGLRMVHSIRPLHLILFVFLSLLLIHTVAVVALIWSSWTGWVSGGWAARLPYMRTPPFVANQSGASRPLWDTVLYQSNGANITFGDICCMAINPYDSYGSLRLPLIGTVEFRADASLVIGCVLAQLGPCVVLLLLRQTRRRFRLRKLHILRGLCLSAAFVPVLYLATEFVERHEIVTPMTNWGRTFKDSVMLTVVLVFCGLATLWWWSFTRRYLKVPHALGVAAAGVVLGVAACMLIGVLTNATFLRGLMA